MYVLKDEKMMYVFRSIDLMFRVMIESHNMKMQHADYTLKLEAGGKCCTVVKDRSGIFHVLHAHETEKVLRIIDLLLDE